MNNVDTHKNSKYRTSSISVKTKQNTPIKSATKSGQRKKRNRNDQKVVKGFSFISTK